MVKWGPKILLARRGRERQRLFNLLKVKNKKKIQFMNLRVKRGTDFMCGSNKTRKEQERIVERKEQEKIIIIGLYDL